MEIVLLDEPFRSLALLPLTFTRPVAALRIGIFTLAEKWANYSGLKVSHFTAKHLQGVFPLASGAETGTLVVNGALLPTKTLVEAIVNLAIGDFLIQNDVILASHSHQKPSEASWEFLTTHGNPIHYEAETVQVVKHPWDIFGFCASEIRKDFDWIKSQRKSEAITDPHTIVYNPDNIFVEAGAKIKAAILNAENGPIYIGKNAEVQEGCIIRGSFSLGESSVINMGAKIRGDSSFGPGCKVGGEVSNSVLQGYSNKGHDGFLGNSVLGEWCNLGADTNTSNLKNNYADVKVWSYTEQDYVNTGRLFCGLIMGDHSKAGINTMFNTGTVVGLGCNVFGAGFPQKYIPNFYWGGADTSFVRYKLHKFLETEAKVMARRNLHLSPEYVALIEYLYAHKRFNGN